MSRLCLSLLAVLAFSACTTRQQVAPIVDRSVKSAPRVKAAPVRVTPSPSPTPRAAGGEEETYTVKKGDNLFRIALEHGLAYRDLALWNQLSDVNDIKVDQVLRLTPPDEPVRIALDAPKVVAVPLSPEKTAEPSVVETHAYPKAVRLPYSESSLSALAVQADGPAVKVNKSSSKPVVASQPKVTEKPSSVVEKRQNIEPISLDWILPTTGKVIRGYSEQAKGIDIQGKVGQPVVASSSGKVVYAGSGLQGYGNLVIIKHNKELLSVYAHNRKLLVAEGDAVKKGEKIAEMGDSDADQVKLHFEIRRFGKPVDPTKFINGG